jgi:D-3-phosphoglycerate dehydrogenase
MFYDPYISGNDAFGFSCSKAANIEAVFENSDFISIHIPYTKDSHHLINKNLLDKMKNSAFIINTSRGGIIDEKDLAEALSSGKIAGAALDVFENEPPEADNPLLKLDNIFLSPHTAALTKESARRMAMHAAEGVADILEGKKPKWVFNRDEIKL